MDAHGVGPRRAREGVCGPEKREQTRGDGGAAGNVAPVPEGLERAEECETAACAGEAEVGHGQHRRMDDGVAKEFDKRREGSRGAVVQQPMNTTPPPFAAKMQREQVKGARP